MCVTDRPPCKDRVFVRVLLRRQHGVVYEVLEDTEQHHMTILGRADKLLHPAEGKEWRRESRMGRGEGMGADRS